MAWEIQTAQVPERRPQSGSAELTALLEAGWELFAVTQDGFVWLVWLKKQS